MTSLMRDEHSTTVLQPLPKMVKSWNSPKLDLRQLEMPFKLSQFTSLPGFLCNVFSSDLFF